MNPQTIALYNQKGGVLKTTTTINLSLALAQQEKSVLVIDNDPQANATIGLGYHDPDSLLNALPDQMNYILNGGIISEEIVKSGIQHHDDGVDLLPSNIALATIDTELASLDASKRPYVLKQIVDVIKSEYDYIIIDCPPSLGMSSINALTASDKVIIPCRLDYYSAKGMEYLFQSIENVRSTSNPQLKVGGILFTAVKERASFPREFALEIKNLYGSHIKFFESQIKDTIRGDEASAMGKGILNYKQHEKVAREVADAYKNLAKEVIRDGAKELGRKSKSETSQCR